MNDLLLGVAELDNAQPDYAAADTYYKGNVTEVMFGSGRVSRRLAASAARYRVNFAKTPVNVVADRLEIAAVTVPGDDAATEALQVQVWDANGMLLETPDANRLACVYGDYYLVVWAGEKEGTVDVYFNSPVSMRLIYDPENPRRKAYAVKRWKAGDRWRVTLYYADRIERWITANPNSAGAREEDWIPYTENDGDAWPIANPYGEVPVFHLRTASPYGVPEHADAYGAQDGLNKLVVTMMSGVDYAGQPLRYALLEGDAAIDGAQPGPPWDDPADATVDTPHRAADLRGEPGDVWIANGLKGVGQLPAADPKAFLDPATFLIRAMAQTTTTPLHYFDPSGDVPSGESLRTADAPLVKKIRYRQMRFASTYAEACAFALKILGFPNAKVDVRWVPSTSTDDKASWETAALKINAGVPVRQVLLEQGYTAVQVDEWIALNGEDNLRQRVLLLGELGKAVQSLGAGISLNAVSAESVQAAVDAILQPVITGTSAELEAA